MGTRQKKRLAFPVVTLGAEYLVMGYLMRRNILAYKAPPNQEGYDLICIHPNPKEATRQIRVQIKSRYQTDCDRAFLLKETSFGKFDYLIGVFQNIGNFFNKKNEPNEATGPEFLTLPASFVRRLHRRVKSGFNKVRTKGLDLRRYEGEAGLELIARDLGIPYPRRSKDG